MGVITFIKYLTDNLFKNNMNAKDLDDLGELYHEYSVFGVKIGNCQAFIDLINIPRHI